MTTEQSDDEKADTEADIVMLLYELAADGISSEGQREWRQNMAGRIQRFITDPERKKQEWIRVKERLPEPYKYVACLTAFNQIFIGQYNIENISEGWSNSTGWYEKGYSDSAREGVLFWYSIPPQSFNKCHLCENEATNRVKDALDYQGYVFDCFICDECRKKIQPILDKKGTAGFVDYLEELEEK